MDSSGVAHDFDIIFRFERVSCFFPQTTAVSSNKVFSNENSGIVSSCSMIRIFEDVSLDIKRGERIAVLGASGSGKSSLLHIAGLLEPAFSGRLFIDGEDCTNLSDLARSNLRLFKIGFVYQFHYLVPELSVVENVMIPLLLTRTAWKHAKEKAKFLLELFGLFDRINYMPAHLSGGQKQRVAMARALVNDPLIVLADEPTGNLDQKTAHRFWESLFQVLLNTSSSFLFATHDSSLISFQINDAKSMVTNCHSNDLFCHRVLTFKNGFLEEEKIANVQL